jgi:hypothetical protein
MMVPWLVTGGALLEAAIAAIVANRNKLLLCLSVCWLRVELQSMHSTDTSRVRELNTMKESGSVVKKSSIFTSGRMKHVSATVYYNSLDLLD